MAKKNNGVVYAEDTKVKKEEKREYVIFPYDKKVAKSYTIVYNKKNKEYELITTIINVETMESTSEISKLRATDTKAKAILEIQRRYSSDLIKGDK